MPGGASLIRPAEMPRTKPIANHKKGSIFAPDFSIILRPHVTRKFFSQNFLCAGIGYSKG
ncbi:hypothetical protein CKO_04635 [Citrobacter koseri ATCC BAA-895]|uniref:Uncharacterized protein n=1 Tax=Citrobacter koseri (strain ATCC BAA-895 / CDC 4225-83 / SGSC4696) TaxID=290338 RepID=A8AQC2_CITK8|nr:hypothetical protein CKO_04635 [Citrobacter koseri ATCC BAA-895]